MKVTAGQLRHAVCLRLSRQLPGIDMATITEPVAEIPTRARIDAASGAVYLGSVQIDSTITHNLYIRTRRNITAEWEVHRGSTVYRIRRVAPLNHQPEFMRLECEELNHG